MSRAGIRRAVVLTIATVVLGFVFGAGWDGAVHAAGHSAGAEPRKLVNQRIKDPRGDAPRGVDATYAKARATSTVIDVTLHVPHLAKNGNVAFVYSTDEVTYRFVVRKGRRLTSAIESEDMDLVWHPVHGCPHRARWLRGKGLVTFHAACHASWTYYGGLLGARIWRARSHDVVGHRDD